MARCDPESPSPFKSDRYYTYRDYRSWPEEECWKFFHGIAMCNQTDKRDIYEKKVSGILGGQSPYLRGPGILP